MADSQTPTLAASAIGAAGFLSGDYTVIVLSALVGGLTALSTADTKTHAQGAYKLFLFVATATIFTTFIAYLLDKYLGIQASKALGPVAWGSAAFGDNWRSIITAAKDRVVALLSGSKPE